MRRPDARSAAANCLTAFAAAILVASPYTGGGDELHSYDETVVATVPDVIPPITAPPGGETVELPTVAVSVPRCAPARMVAESIGLDAAIYEASEDRDINADGAMNPYFFDAIAWDASVGSAPGTDSGSTTYLYGHSSYTDAVFNHLKDLRVGDEVRIETCSGVLRYAVDQVFPISKGNLTGSDDYQASRPGWVVAVTCYRPRGDELRTTDNYVVILKPLFDVNAASAG